MPRPGRIVGRCYACRLPVLAQAATKVTDRAAPTVDGKLIRRLAHRGTCAMELEHRIGGR